MKLPFVSIILIGYNSKPHLDTCFSSIRRINYPKNNYEVIFVDNDSRDGSVNYIKKKFKWIKVVPLDKNYGVATAFNIGVRSSKGKYVVILNPDTEVEKNWLIELVKVMKNDSTIAACGSKLLYYDERNKINSVGGFWSILGFSGSLGEGSNKNDYTKVMEVFFASGTSMIARRDLVLSLGGYDDDYFMYVEETDLGWRLWNMGYKIVSVPSSIVYHKVSASVRRGGSGFKSMVYFHTTKNRLMTIMKNASFLDVLWMLPLSLVSHIFQAVIFLFRGRLDGFLATLRGILWVFIKFSKILEKRNRVVHNNKANKLMLGPVESTKIFISKFKKHF